MRCGTRFIIIDMLNLQYSDMIPYVTEVSCSSFGNARKGFTLLAVVVFATLLFH